MKRIIFVMALCGAISTSSFAQTHLGIIAGPNFARIRYIVGGQTSHTDNLTSFHAGLMLDHELYGNIYIQPQLLLSGKGGKTISSSGYETLNPIYLELPVNFLYKSNGTIGSFVAGLGPYFATGITGKYKSGGASQKITYGSSGYFKAADAGANFIIGYEFNNGLLFNANYSLGLINIYPAGSRTNGREKNAYLGFSAGYLFGK